MAKTKPNQYVLHNDFHRTSCTVHTTTGTLTTEQCDRVRRTLCPPSFTKSADGKCRCNGGALNQRSEAGRNPKVTIDKAGVCHIS